MSGHTKEPWHVDENGLAGYGDNGRNFCIRGGDGESGRRDGDIIAEMPLSHQLLDYGETDDYLETKANARRICLAVNALAGISDSSLEQDVVAKVREALAAIVEFCDDPNGSEKPETLAMGLARILPDARSALALLSDKEAE